jgi:hypothetical protein
MAGRPQKAVHIDDFDLLRGTQWVLILDLGEFA